MDFLDYLNLNKQIEIINNKVYKRYYFNDSYADPKCYAFEFQEAGNILGNTKFNVLKGNEHDGSFSDFTNYQLALDYSTLGDFRGYKIVKRDDEREMGYLLKKYDCNKAYYQYYPVKEESTSLSQKSNSGSTSSSGSSSTSSYSGSESGNSKAFGDFLMAALLPIIGTFVTIGLLTEKRSSGRRKLSKAYWIGMLISLFITGMITITCIFIAQSLGDFIESMAYNIFYYIYFANDILNLILAIILSSK